MKLETLNMTNNRLDTAEWRNKEIENKSKENAQNRMEYRRQGMREQIKKVLHTFNWNPRVRGNKE